MQWLCELHALNDKLFILFEMLTALEQASAIMDINNDTDTNQLFFTLNLYVFFDLALLKAIRKKLSASVLTMLYFQGRELFNKLILMHLRSLKAFYS